MIQIYHKNLYLCSEILALLQKFEFLNLLFFHINVYGKLDFFLYDNRLIERDTGDITLMPYEIIDREEYWNYYSTKYKNVETVDNLLKRVYSCINEIGRAHV